MNPASIDREGRESSAALHGDTNLEELDTLLGRAVSAMATWRELGTDSRVGLLQVIAASLLGQREELSDLAHHETSLGVPRLDGEIERAALQMLRFAEALGDGSLPRHTVQRSVEGRGPYALPDLRKTYRPLGAVAVFTASNFPFAFGVVGGDTASSLAAGCATIVKGHPAHPELSRRLAQLVTEAVKKVGVPEGVFAHVRGLEVGRRLVLDHRIKAAAFTGSYAGGRALFDLAVTRPDPIPFYGEMGSVNPVFISPSAVKRRDEIVEGYLESLTLGAGQFCTNPGLLVAPASAGLRERLVDRLEHAGPFTMLSSSVAERFRASWEHLASLPGMKTLVQPLRASDARVAVGAGLLAISAAEASRTPSVAETECFGPAGVLVTYEAPDEAYQFAASLNGCLVAAVHGDADDPVAQRFLELAEGVSGRVVWNGWPTGVAVAAAQHHGGPFPASTNPLHTSVGTEAIYRFLRPIAYQSVPQTLLPPELRDGSHLMNTAD